MREPMNQNYQLTGINIELTTCCPLRCPQCYCSLEGGRHIPLETAVNAMKQARELGATHVELSGGETMCYPHLYEAVQAASSMGLAPSIAVSGWHFDDTALQKLKEAGIDTIYVSLNAPTEEKNSLTRDGYRYSVSALEVLRRNHFTESAINWVAHRNTVDTLPGMIELAEKYEVPTILIIEPMPTAKGEMNTYPTAEQLAYLAQMVKQQREEKVFLQIQHCFSPLLALASESKLWGNLNRGVYRGCTAGIASCSINVDGQYTPCRHLEIPETYDSLEAYWTQSAYLTQLREMDRNRREPCGSCRFSHYCRHCQAANWLNQGSFFLGNSQCLLYSR